MVTAPNITTTTFKTWIALAFMVVSAVTSSNIIPMSGTAHTVWTVIAVIIGALSTWAAPNKVKTVDGEIVNE